MGFLRALGKRIGAGWARVKYGGAQGVLKLHLAKSRIDSPRTQKLISEATTAAWSIDIVSEFFKSLGFSYDDYDTMYRATVMALRDRLDGEHLIATSIFVNRCREFAPAFRRIAQAVSVLTPRGADRKETLSTLIIGVVNGALAKTGQL
jgi:hypothetical protein